jgi:hypothetical protein
MSTFGGSIRPKETYEEVTNVYVDQPNTNQYMSEQQPYENNMYEQQPYENNMYEQQPYENNTEEFIASPPFSSMPPAQFKSVNQLSIDSLNRMTPSQSPIAVNLLNNYTPTPSPSPSPLFSTPAPAQIGRETFYEEVNAVDMASDTMPQENFNDVPKIEMFVQPFDKEEKHASL